MGMLVLCAARAEVTVEWHGDDDAMVVKVRGADLPVSERLLSEWQDLLAIGIDHPDLKSAILSPPMHGKYAVADGILIFTPQFPLQRGQRYRAVFHTSGDEPPVVAEHEVPMRSATPSTSVNQIYPSAGVLPENLLKFYLHFSGPMSRGHIFDHIHLFDGAGEEVEYPFLEIDEELWNPEMTRLTLFIDPGRIKRGVKLLEEIGPSLTEGKDYKLIIDAAWEDAESLPMVKSFEKAFRVGPVDRMALAPKTWKFDLPSVGSLTELKVRFPEPMDHALARRLIDVVGSDARVLSGKIVLSENERVWSFTPERSWAAGDYQLRVISTIEDLAGNQIGKAFEVDVFEEIDDASLPKTKSIDLPFRIE
ncbi:MAG: hypothetical protein ACI9DF_002922 [Verrucomicrobiales bacterium]|jgi:hypothetical protein